LVFLDLIFVKAKLEVLQNSILIHLYKSMYNTTIKEKR